MNEAKAFQTTSSYQCSSGRNNGEINFFYFLDDLDNIDPAWYGTLSCQWYYSLLILSYHPFSSSVKDNITVSSCLSDSSIPLLNQTINAKQALSTGLPQKPFNVNKIGVRRFHLFFVV